METIKAACGYISLLRTFSFEVGERQNWSVGAVETTNPLDDYFAPINVISMFGQWIRCLPGVGDIESTAYGVDCRVSRLFDPADIDRAGRELFAQAFNCQPFMVHYEDNMFLVRVATPFRREETFANPGRSADLLEDRGAAIHAALTHIGLVPTVFENNTATAVPGGPIEGSLHDFAAVMIETLREALTLPEPKYQIEWCRTIN